jgi:hypothetical protein
MRKVIIFAFFILTGCATTWTKDGGTQQQFNDDKFECELSASKDFPEQLQSRQYGGGQLPSETTCQTFGYTTNCTTYPGAYIPPRTKTVDLNDRDRRKAFERCMRYKGYEKKRPI